LLKFVQFTLTSVVKGGSVAKWLVCWTQAQKGPSSHDAVG